MAAAPTGATSLPRVTTIAPGSLVMPQGMTAPAQQAPAADASATGAAASGGAAPADSAAPTAGAVAAAAPTQAAAPAVAAPKGGVFGAIAGAGLLQRVMALVPVLAGATQAIVGFMITRRTISIASAPLIGKLPPFLVGALVGATAIPTVMTGISRLLGRS